MKSYFLAPIASRENALIALDAVLSKGTNQTWFIMSSDADPMAYISLVESDDVTGLRTIQVDVSGRHYDRDADVLNVLEKLKTILGGEITNDQ